MRVLLRWITALSVVAATGCATTVDTGSFVDRDANFGRYHTFNWAPSTRTDGDSRIEKNAFFKDHLEGEIEKQLTAKGFEGPKNRRPDLLVRYRVGVTPRIEAVGSAKGWVDPLGSSSSSGYGYCSFDCVDRVREYDTATLVIDIVDARSGKIVWRGWARDDLRALLDNQDRMERTIREAVVGMMAKFPANS